MKDRWVTIRAAAATPSIRTAKYNDTEHYVVPVVCMVGNAVVRPLHSEGPEFVPLDELEHLPSAWDGRPCLPDHPADGRGSANNPETLEAHCFGQMFNTAVRDGRLVTEAWLDPARARRGGEVERILSLVSRAAAGETVEPIEVSVGAWVTLMQRDGISPTGERYEYVWTSIVPDHLALGLRGHAGACSVEMGCGAPRVATAKTPEGADMKKSPAVLRAAAESANLSEWLTAALTAVESEAEWLWVESFDPEAGTVVYSMRTQDEAGGTYQRTYQIDGEAVTVGAERVAVRRRLSYEPIRQARAAADLPKEFAKRLAGMLGFQFDAAEGELGASDVELRGLMWKALYASEPGFQEIIEIFPDTGTVIYVSVPEDSVLWWMRTYSMGEDGALTLNEDKTRIEPVTEYRPVQAQGQESASCPCNRAAQDADEGDTMNLKELVENLIACEAAPFEESDRAHLTALGEAKLTAMAARFAPVAAEAEKPEPAAASTAVEPGTVAVPVEEWEGIKAAAAAHRAAQQARKDGLVATLKGAQTVFTEEQLKTREIADLEAMVKLLKLQEAPDYSARPLARAAESDDRPAPPPTLESKVKAARGIAQAN